MLSYDSAWDTERLTEYLAEEILRKERLQWLRSVVGEALKELTDLEKDLVAIRYFGKKRLLQDLQKNRFGERISERDYFRRQQRLAEKLSGLLREKGVTQDVYMKDFAAVDIFQKIHRFVEEGKDRNIFLEERRFW